MGGSAIFRDQILAKMGDKSEFLNFRASWSHFPPSPQNNVDFSISLTAQTTAPTQHCTGGAGGIRELTLEANKIEQMLKYRKAPFLKSVSTTFVAHCRFYLLLQVYMYLPEWGTRRMI